MLKTTGGSASSKAAYTVMHPTIAKEYVVKVGGQEFKCVADDSEMALRKFRKHHPDAIVIEEAKPAKTVKKEKVNG